MRRSIKCLCAAALLALFASALFAAAQVIAPLPEGLLDRAAMTSLRFTDREGNLLHELRSREDGRGVPLPAREPIPAHVRDAFVAAEDHRFFSHPGVDARAIARAAVQNLRAGRVISGASTIAMQLARRLEPHPRDLRGKITETLLALRLTAHLPRERLLREYLDRVPLGNATVGVEAAAFFYFDRPASALSVAQAALLAGIARAPTSGDPFRHPALAEKRKAQVIDAMSRLGFLSDEEARVARAAPIDLVRGERAFRAPHLVAHLSRHLGALGIEQAALVETSIDPALQVAVERAIREELAGLGDRGVGQAAVIVVDNASGEVLAYVGSADFLDEARGGQNDGVRALRQPGSALKPFAYGLALAEGMTPATLLSDVQLHLATPSGAYAPKNYDRRVHGPVRLRAALANSYNVPAVQLMDRLGPGRVLDVLRGAGFASLSASAEHYGVGLVLGNGEVSLRELARAYRGLARGGRAGPLIEVRRALDPEGRLLPITPEMEEARFLPKEATRLLTDILADERARASAFGFTNALRLPFPVAAKTGTSRAHVDNWVVGYTRERTVAVWVGNFDGKPMRGVSGITGAGPLFRRAMLIAMQGVRPAPLVERWRFDHAEICPLSGALAGPWCGSRLSESFLPGTAPDERCPMHRARGELALPAEFYGWALAEGFEAMPALEDPSRPGLPRRAGFILPGDGDEYLLDPALPPEAQSIAVRALPPPGVRRIELALPDGRRRTLEHPFTARIVPVRGRHRVELFLPGEARPFARAAFRVR